MRRIGLILATFWLPLLAPATPAAPAQERESRGEYRSPYRLRFTQPVEALIGDLETTERGDRRLESEFPHGEWSSRKVREQFGSWGPPPRHYPPVPGIREWSTEKKRERVVAVAKHFIGYGYQHHHIPDWDPPAEWPWKPTCVGRNGRGVDCSNFTGFVYNLGFGLKLNTDVSKQAEEWAPGPGRERTPLQRINLPESYDDRIATLRTGDLLFIKNVRGHISHVVIWIGRIGESPDGVPLVMDSHGEDVRDSNDQPIPCGIHLRPFRRNSWYNHSASHALRVFRD